MIVNRFPLVPPDHVAPVCACYLPAAGTLDHGYLKAGPLPKYVGSQYGTRVHRYANWEYEPNRRPRVSPWP